MSAAHQGRHEGGLPCVVRSSALAFGQQDRPGSAARTSAPGLGWAAQEMEERHDRIADEPEIGLLKGQLAQVRAGVPERRGTPSTRVG